MGSDLFVCCGLYSATFLQIYRICRVSQLGGVLSLFFCFHVFFPAWLSEKLGIFEATPTRTAGLIVFGIFAFLIVFWRASEAQVGQPTKGEGTVISQPAKQADRISAQTGANPANIQKVSLDAHIAKDGQQVQTHSFRDASNNHLREPKTIIDDQK